MSAPIQQSGPVTPSHLAVWATDGVMEDGGAPAQIMGTNNTPGVFTNVGPEYPYAFHVGAPNIASILSRPTGPYYNEDALQGAILAPAGSTQYQINGVSGLAQSDSASTYAVGGFFIGVCGASGVYAWGTNPGVNDGGFVSPLIQGEEIDVTSSNGGTNANGISINFTLAARTTGRANGIVISVGGAGTLTASYETADGNITYGLYLGSNGAVASSNSQIIALNGRDASNNSHQAYLEGVAGTACTDLYMTGAGTGARVRAGSPVQLPSYTIASGANQLPSASATYSGCKAYVTDFNGSPTYHGAIGAGGGSTGTPVFCNGSAWLTD